MVIFESSGSTLYGLTSPMLFSNVEQFSFSTSITPLVVTLENLELEIFIPPFPAEQLDNTIESEVILVKLQLFILHWKKSVILKQDS